MLRPHILEGMEAALSTTRTTLALAQVTLPERQREMVGQLIKRSLFEQRDRLPIGDPAIVNECPVTNVGFQRRLDGLEQREAA